MISVLFQSTKVQILIPSELSSRFPYNKGDVVFIRCDLSRFKIEHSIYQEWGINDFPQDNPSHILHFQATSVAPPEEHEEHPLTIEGEYYWTELISPNPQQAPIPILCWADKKSAYYAVITDKEHQAIFTSSSEDEEMSVLVRARLGDLEQFEDDDRDDLYADVIPVGEVRNYWIYGEVSQTLN